MAGSQGVPGTRGSGQSALLILVDGLIDRMLRSPLMRRAPAQCAPEEQEAQAALLGDIVAVRGMRQAVEALPHIEPDQVAEYWPELAALLAPARRGTTSRTRTGGSARPAPALGGLYDALPSDTGDGPGGTDDDTTTEIEEPPVGPLPALSGGERPDLAPLLQTALQGSEKPLNTTQMLTWLHQRGSEATREDVMNALLGHEDLFKKRGAGQWMVSGREPATA
jgi:hypothetical protein